MTYAGLFPKNSRYNVRKCRFHWPYGTHTIYKYGEPYQVAPPGWRFMGETKAVIYGSDVRWFDISEPQKLERIRW